jgi:large subunit ribosomal protein L2
MLKKFKPTTHSNRHKVRVIHTEVSKVEPEKSLTRSLKYKAARNQFGHITVRGRGGRAKRQYREIDFKREMLDVEGSIKTIEFDPNRSCYISLVVYPNGAKKYILTPEGLKIGDKVVSSKKNVNVKPGNSMPLKNIPPAVEIHNVITSPNSDRGYVRSAGSFATVMGKNGEYVQLKLPSGEIRLINGENFATVGKLSNPDNKNQRFGKTGTLRHMGFRPIVRGVAQHPRSHPHGGGQGKAGRHGTGGNPVDQWGNKRFAKTRNNKITQRFIVTSRTGVKSKSYKNIT